MKTRLLTACLALALGVVAAIRSSDGAVVLLKENDEPVVGYLVRQDAERVVIREPLPGGGTREREIPRAEIDELLITVDPARLTALSPDKPQGYLEYAEDLAEKKRDPEARDTALRLYLIAAWLAPDRLGRSALLGMSELGRTAEERRACRALAFLLDKNHDPGLLRDDSILGSLATSTGDKSGGKPVGGKSGDVASGAATRELASDPLLECLRQLRRGHRNVAKRLAERPEVRRDFPRVAEILSFEEFQAGCLDPAPRADLLQKLLQAELMLLPTDGTPVRSTAETAPAASWRSAVTGAAPPLPLLTLERLTEFDPRACVYLAGRWVEPKK